LSVPFKLEHYHQHRKSRQLDPVCPVLKLQADFFYT